MKFQYNILNPKELVVFLAAFTQLYYNIVTVFWNDFDQRSGAQALKAGQNTQQRRLSSCKVQMKQTV